MNPKTWPASTYWVRSVEDLLAALQGSRLGLSSAEAQERLAESGPNALKRRKKAAPWLLLLRQFKSPLVLILVFAAVISVVTGAWIDASIILAIVVASAVLGFVQEYRAGHAVEKLRSRVTLRANLLRDGEPRIVPAEEVVPGDIVLLSAGSLIPADGAVIQADDFFVNQAILTGETFPVEKKAGAVAENAGLAERTNSVFMGTNVSSGSARVLICETGVRTEFGRIAEKLALRSPETDFERGIRQFGGMLTQVMMALVLVVFAINVFLHKPAVDSLLFAVALAVGVAPELLPAIISITLAKGAQSMAKKGVIVRHLAAIENFGSMDVLCTDKTGTLTLGVVSLDGALDPLGNASDQVLLNAYLNARFQTGLANPLDEAILRQKQPEIGSFVKTEEIPYDFLRKRLSIAVQDTARNSSTYTLITKGALDKVLEASSHILEAGQAVLLDEARQAALLAKFAGWSEQGFRVLGLATKEVAPRERYSVEEESGMTFIGFLLFFDPPKPDALKAISDLKNLGVTLKVITGDNRRVALHVAQATGMKVTGVLTGAELNRMRDEALWQQAERVNLFAEVDPNQKERIISALRKTGHVVGYMGDGINDAPALHAADVGISVDSAVDVAKEAADFVLLDQSLDVLRHGIEQGRRTFANTLKYVFTTTSANFGNMFSMAGLSMFLPFLPLLPKQILLNNFMSDFPAMTIASDAVDPEMVDRPRRWDVAYIRNFMIVFGLISSVFDFLTFGLLLLVLRAGESQFRTGWFVESLFTELFILLVVRTHRSLFKSKPGGWLWGSTLLVGLTAIVLPYLPGVGPIFGFVPLPPVMMAALLGITGLYVAANEFAKQIFYRRIRY
ncbi:MAG: magnesium-translocating P-type ATPase [Candidatus Aminicenantes bacterium]|nr:magnesium-translocating P-type ATPase [Candidatus Aminicenantes bacterium]